MFFGTVKQPTIVTISNRHNFYTPFRTLVKNYGTNYFAVVEWQTTIMVVPVHSNTVNIMIEAI